jgi:MFS family permease
LAGPVVISDDPGPARTTAYAWAVFALSFGLLMSDHMARQVLGAVSPLLKVEWSLSDAQLSALSSVVALAVGVLSIPLSLAADRFGRVKSLFVMATLWSLATLGGAYAQSYPQLLFARLLVGVGEAAYGSVGIAVVLAVFPRHLRATLSSAFLAGSVVGQMAGVALGGQVAAVYGWRSAFEVIGFAGLAMAIAYPIVVRESRIGSPPTNEPIAWRALVQALLGKRVLWLIYFSGGIQLFCTGALAFWLPSLLGRYYAMPVDRAGKTAALFLLVCAVGMVGCGIIADRRTRSDPAAKPVIAITYSLITAALFFGAFTVQPGALQLALLAGGLLTVGGIAGICGAMVANLTPRQFHGTAMGVLTLAYNLFGLAPGPWVIGKLADRFGLIEALMLLPIPCLLAALGQWLVLPLYRAEIARQAEN